MSIQDLPKTLVLTAVKLVSHTRVADGDPVDSGTLRIKIFP